MFTYHAVITNIVDGDTVDMVIDVGFYLTYSTRARLSGIDAPEPRGATRRKGDAATDHLESMIPPGTKVVVRTSKDDSFGRWIVEIWLNGENVNEVMVKDGHAVFKEY